MAPDLILELPNDLTSIEEVVEHVMRRCAPCGEHHRRLRLNLRVGLTEALANAMLYGNEEDPAKRVRVEVAFRDSGITARVTDEGDGFDPCRVPDPTCPANLLKSHGRGIFLMRRLLDEVYFNDRGNSVTMVLRFLPPEGEAGASGRARA